ncbi:MAG: AAA family ATPase [Methylococcales bacterium]|nr:AAA family ATPase [Methylococcales bacterium]
MLKRIHIRNFLSCIDTDIELDGVTALIGRNAAGKTNVLKAIERCARFAVGTESVFENFDFDSEANFEIEFLIGDNLFRYELKTPNDYRRQIVSIIENLFCFISDGWQIIVKREDENVTHYNKENSVVEIKSYAPMINSLLSLMPENEINPAIIQVHQYFSAIKYYMLDDQYESAEKNPYSAHIDNSSYKQWLAKRNKTKSPLVMKLLYLWHKDKETLAELNALIGENGLNIIKCLDIEKYPVGLKDEDSFFTVNFVMVNSTVSYRQLSYGTQRVLAILLALLYDNCSTLLIEQPEDGIHSGLLKKLLPLCFEYGAVYNRQIIIATHSPDVINLVPPESIRLVRMTENGTKVSSLDTERLPYIHDYLKNEGALFDVIDAMDDE